MASISVRYLPEDFLEAWRLQLRHNAFVRVCRFAPLVLLAVFGLGSWTDFRDYGLVTGVISILPTVVMSGLLLGLNIFGDRVLLPRRAQRFIAQQKNIQGEISISWDDEGVTFAAKAGQSLTAWADYFKWLENDAVLVIFQSENMLNVLPRRCLTDSQITEIRERLEATLGPAGRKQKSAPFVSVG